MHRNIKEAEMSRQSGKCDVLSKILSGLLLLMIAIGYTPVQVEKINNNEQISIPCTTHKAQFVSLPSQEVLAFVVKRIRKENLHTTIYLLVFAVMYRRKPIKWERLIGKYKTHLKLEVLMDYIHDMDGKKQYSFC